MPEELERLAFIREYFESGCRCIVEGNLAVKPKDCDDQEAITFYEKNCRCSRNYIKNG